MRDDASDHAADEATDEVNRCKREEVNQRKEHDRKHRWRESSGHDDRVDEIVADKQEIYSNKPINRCQDAVYRVKAPSTGGEIPGDAAADRPAEQSEIQKGLPTTTSPVHSKTNRRMKSIGTIIASTKKAPVTMTVATVPTTTGH